QDSPLHVARKPLPGEVDPAAAVGRALDASGDVTAGGAEVALLHRPRHRSRRGPVVALLRPYLDRLRASFLHLGGPIPHRVHLVELPSEPRPDVRSSWREVRQCFDHLLRRKLRLEVDLDLRHLPLLFPPGDSRPLARGDSRGDGDRWWGARYWCRGARTPTRTDRAVQGGAWGRGPSSGGHRRRRARQAARTR